jgi:hypothetical protein
MPEATAGRLLVITTWACFPADGGSLTAQPVGTTCQPSVSPYPVRTCSTYGFKGALRAPGRGWPSSMRKRRAMATLTVERRCVRP